MNLNNTSTTELQKELERRKNDPTWFIRDLVADGYDLDTPEFDQAASWMDEPVRQE